MRSSTETAGSLSQTFTHRFSPKPHDPLTSLTHYQLRPYSPPTGRFISSDPIKERGGVNLYVFTGNSPVTKWDYLGYSQSPMKWIGEEPDFIGGQYIAIYGVANIVFSVTWEKTEYDCCNPKKLIECNDCKKGPHYFSNLNSTSYYDFWNSDLSGGTVLGDGMGSQEMGTQGELVIVMAWSFDTANIPKQGLNDTPPPKAIADHGYAWNIHKHYPWTNTPFPPFTDENPIPDENQKVTITVIWNNCEGQEKEPIVNTAPPIDPGSQRREDWEQKQWEDRK